VEEEKLKKERDAERDEREKKRQEEREKEKKEDSASGKRCVWSCLVPPSVTRCSCHRVLDVVQCPCRGP
jgi:hypothetical protein